MSLGSNNPQAQCNKNHYFSYNMKAPGAKNSICPEPRCFPICPSSRQKRYFPKGLCQCSTTEDCHGWIPNSTISGQCCTFLTNTDIVNFGWLCAFEVGNIKAVGTTGYQSNIICLLVTNIGHIGLDLNGFTHVATV